MFRISKKVVDFYMASISFAIFGVRSIDVKHRIVGLVNSQKLLKACFMLVVVFLVCFFWGD